MMLLYESKGGLRKSKVKDKLPLGGGKWQSAMISSVWGSLETTLKNNS